MSEIADHWDGIYSTGTTEARSWYEQDPDQSLRLIDRVIAGKSAAIIDVGSGTSTLVDRLVDKGFSDVTVLDISAHALAEVRRRLGASVRGVTVIRNDVLSWEPERAYDVWHDRAVFHFLTDPEQRSRYVSVATTGVRAGGCAIIATFAEDGPTQCSGLPVVGYSAHRLAGVFGAAFEPVHEEHGLHRTPAGAVQPFTWIILRRM